MAAKEASSRCVKYIGCRANERVRDVGIVVCTFLGDGKCKSISMIISPISFSSHYNEDLNNAKSRSKELIVEIEEEQRRQAII
jgi:hypothetical protein